MRFNNILFSLSSFGRCACSHSTWHRCHCHCHITDSQNSTRRARSLHLLQEEIVMERILLQLNKCSVFIKKKEKRLPLGSTLEWVVCRVSQYIKVERTI